MEIIVKYPNAKEKVKSAFTINFEKQTIRFNSEWRNREDEYHIGVENGKHYIILTTKGTKFNRRSVPNAFEKVPFENYKTNNFGLKFIRESVYEIIPLTPRVFPTPSEETIKTLTNAGKAYREVHKVIRITDVEGLSAKEIGSKLHQEVEKLLTDIQTVTQEA